MDPNVTDFLLWRPASGTAPDTDPLSDTDLVTCTVNVYDCQNLWFSNKTAGMIKLSNTVANSHSNRDSFRECQWSINVPDGHYIMATIDKVDNGPTVFVNTRTIFDDEYVFVELEYHTDKGRDYYEREHSFTLPVFLSTTNKLKFVQRNDHKIYLFPNSTLYNIRFQTVEEPVTELLRSETSAPGLGTITPPGYNIKKCYANKMEAFLELSSPKDNSVVLSAPHFYLRGRSWEKCQDYLELRTISPLGTEHSRWKKCGRQVVLADVFLQRIVPRFVTFPSSQNIVYPGFQLQFSFHPLLKSPRRLGSGRFNCSVPYFDTFKHHLMCNGAHECHHSEDESPQVCPFTCVDSNHSFTVGKICYNLARSSTDNSLTQDEAEEQCRSRGGVLAMLKTRLDWQGFHHFLSSPASKPVKVGDAILLGLWTSLATQSDLYRYVWTWRDETVC